MILETELRDGVVHFKSAPTPRPRPWWWCRVMQRSCTEGPNPMRAGQCVGCGGSVQKPVHARTEVPRG